MNRYSILIVSLALAAGTAVAQAPQSTINARSTRVSWGELDLAREQGQQALYSRLRAAAKTVCGQPSSYELREHRAVERCRNDALAKAIEQIDAPSIASAAQLTW